VAASYLRLNVGARLSRENVWPVSGRGWQSQSIPVEKHGR